MFKIISYFTILFLISSNVFADGTEPDGSGTEKDPYQVETLDNLLWISTNNISWDKHFIQTTDIDASDTQNWNNGEGFSPIGIYPDDPFTGSYDGEEHITNYLHIVLPETDYIGFFAFTNDASISNLGLENIDVTGHQGVGGLVGWNDNSRISNCYSTGSIIGYQEVGGLVGYSHFSTTMYSYSTGSVSGDGAVGGLVGFSNDASTISNCYSMSSVSGNNGVGGLVGMNIYSIISNSYSNCSITGHNSVGGMVGENYESCILNCYCNGSVTEGNGSVGGLVGWNNSCSIINCYSTTSVVGNGSVGGLIGSIDYPDVQNSFWDIQTSGQTTSAGGTGKTTAEMQDVATYTSLATVGLEEPWDFVGNPYDDIGYEDFWDIGEGVNNGYPYFANQIVGIDDGIVNNNSKTAILFGNYPNPFNSTTTIEFAIQNSAKVELVIYNNKGQKIKTLINERCGKGHHSFTWNGNDGSGHPVSSGFYMYGLEVDGKNEAIKKCLLLK